VLLLLLVLRDAVLEMTHNWGTESDESFQHFSGNEVRPGCGSDGRGFGHIGFLVDDVYTACEVPTRPARLSSKPLRGCVGVRLLNGSTQTESSHTIRGSCLDVRTQSAERVSRCL
jgi:hypothetical protein